MVVQEPQASGRATAYLASTRFFTLDREELQARIAEIDLDRRAPVRSTAIFLGPLFRFNRECENVDTKGKRLGFRGGSATAGPAATNTPWHVAAPGRVHGAAQRGTRRTGGRGGGGRGRRCGPGAHRRQRRSPWNPARGWWRAALRTTAWQQVITTTGGRPIINLEQLRDDLVTAHGATLRRVFVRDGDEAVLVVLALPPEGIAEEERRLGESTAILLGLGVIHGAERQGDRSGDPRIDAPTRRSGADRVAGG